MDKQAPATSQRNDRPALRVLLAWASLIIIVAGMRAAAALVVPLLLAIFLAILSAPALQWLCRRRVPQWLAMLIVLAGLCVVGLAFVIVVSGTIDQFFAKWPQKYGPRIAELTDAWNQMINTQAENHEWLAKWKDNLMIGTSGLSQWSDQLEPGTIMQRFMGVMRAFSGILSQALLILATTIFLLIEGTSIPDKLQAMGGESHRRIQELRRIANDVNSYMAIKTSTSLLTGGLVTVALWLLGVDFPLLWGLIAFLLNYVPNIGSILAAVPAVLLTLLQLGFGTALAVVGLYLGVNMLIGYFIEPRWMGKGLGLSTLVVFISLVFWGWVLGPVGMVISVPLTMTVKIALENSDDTQWLAILMGPSVRPSSETTATT